MVQNIRSLMEPFTHKEISNIIKQLQSDKTRRFNGFTVRFFWKFWDIVGQDLNAMIFSFLDRRYLLKSINQTFICLVLKGESCSMNYFKPIKPPQYDI